MKATYNTELTTIYKITTINIDLPPYLQTINERKSEKFAENVSTASSSGIPFTLMTEYLNCYYEKVAGFVVKLLVAHFKARRLTIPCIMLALSRQAYPGTRSSLRSKVLGRDRFGTGDGLISQICKPFITFFIFGAKHKQREVKGLCIYV